MYTLENLEQYLTEEQIEKIEEKIFECVEKYDIDNVWYDNLRIYFNNRLRTVAGYFKFYHDRSIKKTMIELNPKYIKEFGFENVLKTFAHEMAHFVCHTTGIETGSEHCEKFKMICDQLGGSMNEGFATGKYAHTATTEFIESSYKWQYKCECGYINKKTKRRKTLKRRLYFFCPKCKETIGEMESKL